MKRRPVTPALTRRVLLAQGVVPCALCGKRILAGDETVMEHLHALALGGADDESNMRLVHKACADRKTNGTKATTAGSDAHLIAKGKRLRGETGQNRRKAPIRSRGFDKTVTRKMDGTITVKGAK